MSVCSFTELQHRSSNTWIWISIPIKKNNLFKLNICDLLWRNREQVGAAGHIRVSVSSVFVGFEQSRIVHEHVSCPFKHQVVVHQTRPLFISHDEILSQKHHKTIQIGSIVSVQFQLVISPWFQHFANRMKLDTQVYHHL